MPKKTVSESITWLVGHPEHCTVPVLAPDWELATVGAARLWGVPWAKVAAECRPEGKKVAKKLVCIKCGRVDYSQRGETAEAGHDGLCAECRLIIRQDEENARRRMNKTWYLAPKGAGNGA